MSEVKTEEEQIEAFKTWWKKNGTSLVLAVAVGVGGYFGWQAWQSSQENHLAEASSLYQSLTEASANIEQEENQKTIRYLAEQLSDEYDDTGYALYGQLFVARVAVQNGEYEAALEALQSIVSQTEDASLTTIANVRIARLQAELEQYDDALATLDSVDAPAFAGQVQELRGDIMLAQGDRDGAREAYEAAAANLGEDAQSPLLRVKLKDLVSG
ncbi:tetratricopeptide repeat protein [Marinomonas ostreistagni]|uniref:tetratricopeptide repeat protein n=1 Tax=Marinomonas ostreistagni TaxID=359209 RepID=UPI00194F8FF0|nr:tetratricopeptide repeat protein [Marinomonas ostreistagni]